jgi:hypothetical protein
MDILRALSDDNVFEPHFRGDSWDAWRAFLAALFGLPLTPTQLAYFKGATGRETPPETPSDEAWLVCGRRAGKSFVLATVAVFLACFRDWRPHLGPGERATVMVIAADRKQARVIMRYVVGLLRASPMLARTIAAERAEGVDLAHGVTIEVHTASFRTVRGYTVVAALLDEIAFWPSEDSTSPDTEIVAAIRPAMATVPGAVMLCASSPHARRGALWEAYRDHHGRDGEPVLVWQAPTRTMNPSVPQRVVDAALAADPDKNAAEYLAEFRTDVETFVAREAVEAVVPCGVRERGPLAGVRYRAFVDPSGGSSDAMTLAVAHSERGRIVLDVLREVRPPFSPEGVVAEFADAVRAFRITTVSGDRYAGQWPREQFLKRSVEYFPAAVPKSDLYLQLLPVINSGGCELLDDAKLVNQLCQLERRTARGGRDSIDHPRGGHDDLANAVAGVVHLVSQAHRMTQRAALAAPIIIRPGVDYSRRDPRAWHALGRF